MNIKVILVVLGEPNSIFSELLFKYFSSSKFKKNKKKIILIGCKKLIENQMKFLGYKVKLNEINNINTAKTKHINILNIDYKFKKIFTKISSSSNEYIEKCFTVSINILKNSKHIGLINGPVSKKHFLKKTFPGVTEYISKKINTKNPVMLIYNKKLSVCPLSTHIPLKNVTRYVKKKKIILTANKLNNFFKLILNKKPNIAVLGLNPHCETIDKISEEKKEIIPAIKYLKKKKLRINGPFSPDTFFLQKNIKEYDVVLGMYHDQVLSPVKTLFKFEAINITLGLPFIKVTPDHGPNYEMIGKKISDPSSVFYAFDFYNKI